ncbi:MAG TPA: ACP S-malonyltransferase [Thermoanaerobaculia bacterium]|nr:ACP S-malonyltransferase [Thermoanaerobaculia bacterium]HUM30895.1 ACP S-malonyltransferase [Thermoanaerobaculia bacterium]HXK69206.1 ACP S-malonyltransferase [Thermoanaerobaculia bacterium]
MKTALLFPGQGAQFTGMGSDLFAADPKSSELLEIADRTLHFHLSELIRNGPEEELQKTANTQPGILTVSSAFASYLKRHGLMADMVAGHSLGEYSALVYAGAITFEDAVRMVHLRGKYMQEAVPEREGAMAAILGLTSDQVVTICSRASEAGVVCAANFNAPEQTVISGSASGVEAAIQLAREEGAKRAVPLKVSAPFHSPLMELARVRMTAVLNNVSFSRLRMPLVNNIDAMPIQEGEAARDGLIRQVDGPVRWVETIRTMANAGVTRYIEVAPGKVLSGLVKRIQSDAEVVSLSTYDEMTQFLGGTS